MTYDPKLHHFAFPVAIMATGGAIINRFGTGVDVLALAAPFYFGGFSATVWMIGQGWLGYLAEIEQCRSANAPQVIHAEPEPVPAADGFTPMRKGWRMWGPTGKNKKHVLQSSSIAVNLVQKDMRWQQFAEDILYHKAPISQAKWTGRGKMFSKTEFAPRINEWVRGGYLATVNPHSANQGYKIHGAHGRDYFHGLATGREFIPLPHSG